MCEIDTFVEYIKAKSWEEVNGVNRPNAFEEWIDSKVKEFKGISICPECCAEVQHGVCQSKACKERLL